jgi:L-amino acid N-acyltransferase YncA
MITVSNLQAGRQGSGFQVKRIRNMKKNVNAIIIPLLKKHWADVSLIYRKGIETGIATFEKEVPEWSMWDSSHLKCCRWVAISADKVIGWAALSKVSDRCCYNGVAEVSIYVDPSFQGRGIGSLLLKELIESSEKKGFWTLQAGIFPENTDSINLHRKFGFRIVGIREKLGKLDETWKDVMFLERRSKRTGIE